MCRFLRPSVQPPTTPTPLQCYPRGVMLRSVEKEHLWMNGDEPALPCLAWCAGPATPIWWCLAWIHFHAACPCQTELLWVVTHMPLSLWEFLTTHRRTGGTCGVTTTSTFIVSHCHRGSRREAHSFIVCLSLAAAVSVSSSAHLDLIVWHVRHTQHKRNRGGSRVGVL